MSNFPTILDSFTNPSANSPRNNPSLAQGQTDQNNALIAIETKMGTGASTPVVNTVLRGTGTGTSSFSQIQTADISNLAIDYSKIAIKFKAGWDLLSATGTRTGNNGLTVTGDITDRLWIGKPLELTDTAEKHFYLTSFSYSSGTGLTTLGFTAGIDAILVGNPTNIYGGLHSSPVGFPGGFLLATNKYLTMDGKNVKIKIFSSIQGIGTSIGSETITYGITLTTLKSITITSAGRKSTSAPANITECVDSTSEFTSLEDPTTSQVKVWFENVGGGNIINTLWIGYSLVVEGII